MIKNLKNQVKLDRYSTWRVGGYAEKFYVPESDDDLKNFLMLLPADEPLFFLGLGSNTVIRDGGIRGTVVALGSAKLQTIERRDTAILYAQASVSCAKLARAAARLGLRGLEFLAGIPGTVGGALAMNAGCHGGQTWDYVVACETVDRAGCRRLRRPDEFQVSYRQVIMPATEYFLSATFQCELGDKEASFALINKLLAHRSATQPINLANGGCVFRNPDGDSAGRLIDVCGLKGLAERQARVSDKHANFIVHDGQASARDIERLIYRVREAVYIKTGILLELETRIVGTEDLATSRED